MAPEAQSAPQRVRVDTRPEAPPPLCAVAHALEGGAEQRLSAVATTTAGWHVFAGCACTGRPSTILHGTMGRLAMPDTR